MSFNSFMACQISVFKEDFNLLKPSGNFTHDQV
jgi:hypothetical protein